MKKRKREKTKNLIVYTILRFLIVLTAVAQAIRGDWNSVFTCFLALLLFAMPTIVKKKFNIKLPGTLEVLIYIFIFAAEILGEIQNFYGIFKHWDTMLHTINGFLCAAIGFSLIDILNREDHIHFNLSPVFVAIVALCFSMTIGVLWEFGEFTVDRYLNRDAQKDRIINKIVSVELNNENNNRPIIIDNITRTELYSNDQLVYVIEYGYLDIGLIDTMKDLFVNFIGAVIFSILGFLYIKDREANRYLERFIPVIKELEE